MNQQIQAFIEIDDLSLTAALLTMGYKPCDTPFVKYSQPNGKTKYKFFIQAESGVQELIQAWRTDGWESLSENEEKPFAYIKAFFKNREGLLDVVKQSGELIVIENKGRTAIISKDAADELQDKIFRKL